jgi:hypothetical protein
MQGVGQTLVLVLPLRCTPVVTRVPKPNRFARLYRCGLRISAWTSSKAGQPTAVIGYNSRREWPQNRPSAAVTASLEVLSGITIEHTRDLIKKNERSDRRSSPHPELAQWNPGERREEIDRKARVFSRAGHRGRSGRWKPGDFFGRRPTFRDCSQLMGGDFILLWTESASGDPSKSRFCGVWAAQRG